MAVSDLTPNELQGLVKEAVFQRVAKAIGVYLLISAVIGVIIAIVNASLRVGGD